jgi:hypothetical protein
VSIPAIEPTVTPGPDGPGLPPGTVLADITATLDDITFGMVDEFGVAWRLTGDLDGWDSAGLDEGAANRTAADGVWDTPNYYGSRIVTLEGLIIAPDAAAREDAQARLSRALPARGRYVSFRVDEAIPKSISGRRSGRLMCTPSTDRVAAFSAAILAPDPRKYGTALRTADLALPAPGGGLAPPWTPPVLIPARQGSETTVVVNAGGYETPPVIRLAGPGTDLGVANLTTGQVLSFAGEVGAGHALIVDVGAGTALLDGTADRSPLPGSALIAEFMLQRGENRLQMLGTRTDVVMSATAEVTWRDAWI